MTQDKSKAYILQAMIKERLGKGEQEIEVINNCCEAEHNSSGSMSVDIMLNGPPTCPESGFAATEVSFVCLVPIFLMLCLFQRQKSICFSSID
jgi:hypothetical protein